MGTQGGDDGKDNNAESYNKFVETGLLDDWADPKRHEPPAQNLIETEHNADPKSETLDEENGDGYDPADLFTVEGAIAAIASPGIEADNMAKTAIDEVRIITIS